MLVNFFGHKVQLRSPIPKNRVEMVVAIDNTLKISLIFAGLIALADSVRTKTSDQCASIPGSFDMNKPEDYCKLFCEIMFKGLCVDPRAVYKQYGGGEVPPGAGSVPNDPEIVKQCAEMRADCVASKCPGFK